MNDLPPNPDTITGDVTADVPVCPCETCNQPVGLYRRFTMCPYCGNKRCPKGTDHNLDCTASNEPGQPGSSWEHYTT